MDRYSPSVALVLLSFLAVASAADYTIVDVQRVPLHGDTAAALVHVSVPERPEEIACDALIGGAGMGGIGAALALAERGHSVCLTEETDWVGGQATAGGVSALDENRFIEFSGATRKYRLFRAGIRQWYARNRSLTPAAKSLPYLNPGSCYVSPLCFEPVAGLEVLQQMLRQQPKIRVFLRSAIFEIDRRGNRIDSALAWQFERQSAIRFRPRFVLDATEMGDLLPLAHVPYVVGAEAKSDTGEPDAASTPNRGCVQSFTYPFVLEHAAAPGPAAEKPSAYDAIVKRQSFSLRVNYPEEFGWKGWVQYRMFGDDPPVPNNMSPGPFFPWRRLVAARNFENGVPNDLALINWPRQDYAAESPLDQSPSDLARILQAAKQNSQAFLYWLQHDVARDGGGRGYPELKLRPEMMGSGDGMSKYPYIRESRRMLARGRVTEQDIVEDTQPGPRARWFADSVGTGFYMVDIHPCGANERGRMRMPKPFQIPMSALLPKDPINFLPAGKNLGVTHLTNGAFRLHPVEWNTGEAAGTIAALWLERGSVPEAQNVQTTLAAAGVPMVWFDDLAPDHPAFAAIQLAVLRGAYPMRSPDLHASPDAPVTRGEAAAALVAYFGSAEGVKDAAAYAVRQGWMATDHRNWFHADLPFYWADWREDKFPRAIPSSASAAPGPVRRREFAERLTRRP